KWGPLERGDLRDENDLRRAFETWRPWAVTHFAAHAYVGESILEPLKYYDTNVGGTAKLLKTCAAFGCRNVVFSSSCATYGIPTRVPLTETDAQQPINPYGYAKLVVEQMLQDAEIAHGIRHVALRYFNAAGADPDGELGNCTSPKRIWSRPFCFPPWDRHHQIPSSRGYYATPDGTCVRDYIHVSDLADAHVAASSGLWRTSRAIRLILAMIVAFLSRRLFGRLRK